MIYNPCLDCQERPEGRGCGKHSECVKYAKYRAEKAEEYKLREQEVDLGLYYAKRKAKIRKVLRRLHLKVL